MGRYVTAGRCLDCQASLYGADVCPVCAMPQTGPDAEDLRRLLAAAEQVLPRLRTTAFAGQRSGVATGPGVSFPPPTPPPAPTAGPVGASTPLLPFQPVRPIPPRARTLPAISTPVLLLGLGATSVLVAAVVFVSVQWSDLPLATKAAILVVITAGLAVAAFWSLRKRLRGSAEAFAGLTTAFVAIDFAAAQASDLVGLGVLSDTAAAWLLSILLTAIGAGWAYASTVVGTAVPARSDATAGPPATRSPLVSVQLFALAGVVGLIANSYQQLSGVRAEYVALPWTLALLATAIGLRDRYRASAAGLGVLGAMSFVHAALVSLARLVTPDTFGALWSRAEPLGLVCCCLLLAGVAQFRLHVPVPTAARHLAACAASAGGLLVALRPLADEGFDPVVGVLALLGLAFGLGFAFVVRHGVWHTAAGLNAVGSAGASAVLVLPSVLSALIAVSYPIGLPWKLSVDSTVSGLELELIDGSAWAVVVGLVLASVTAVLVVLRRLPSAWMAALVLTSALSVAALRNELALWRVVVVVAALTGACLIVAVVRRSAPVGWAALVGAALTLGASIGAPLTTLVVAATMSVGLSLACVALRTRLDANVSAALALVLSAVAASAAVSLTTVDQRTIAVVLTVLGAVTIVAAQVRAAAIQRIRPGLELAAGATLVVGLSLAVPYVDVRLPVLMTFAGVALGSVSLVSSDRRVLSWVSGLLIAGASWVRLAVEEVTVVEAYTLPSALVLLAFGVWRLWQHRGSASLTTLGPGLGLALLPSLVAALPEPTSVRALVVGLAGVMVLLVGGWQRLAAPLVFGGGALGVLLVVNIAPYAAALPRWILFAVLGAGLLLLGVTWEGRLRNARAFGTVLRRLS